jgi:four helix bundle protein
MTQSFGHEKLIVYQKGMCFVALRSALLGDLVRRVAACDHLDRGAESILVNIAHASSNWSHEDLDVYRTAIQFIAWLDPMLAKFSCSADLRSKLDKSTTAIALNIAEGNGRFTGADQSKYYETAYKATILSASLLDLAGGNGLEDVAHIDEGRELLRRVAAMLTALSKAVTHECRT